MFKSLVLLCALASPVLSQPAVSLLIDFAGYNKSGTLNLRSILNSVSARKGSTFHFGSTYDTSESSSFMTNVFGTFFNHIVAENACKWQSTEPSRGTSSLGGCQGVQSFGTNLGTTFRGHNTFWHVRAPHLPLINAKPDFSFHDSRNFQYVSFVVVLPWPFIC
jgi:endo-1,4-beta-xylanase